MFPKLILPSLFILLGLSLSAQKATLQGTVTDFESKLPVADAAVTVQKTGIVAATDAAGMFLIEKMPAGEFIVQVSAPGFQVAERPVKVKKGGSLVVDIVLKREIADNTNADLPTVTLEEADDETNGGGEVANLLHASRDVFQQISGYSWFAFRFRERGYDGENFPVYLNGVSINDPETGYAVFGEFGGLNDVMRRRESTVGMEANDFAFSEIGGASNIDTRASVQRKTTRASFAKSNRSYNNRVMLTMNTGLMPKGWAVSMSASRRWADVGTVPGTYFNGYSYFLSVDKKFGHKHTLNLTFLGAPSVRGRQTDTNAELFKLYGDNLYNPSWGYQNGKIRNAAVANTNQPIAIFRYDWNPSRKTGLSFSTYGQAGKRADERLEWANAYNPNPDYYRRLPSFIEDEGLSAAQAQFLQADEKNRQIRWDDFFDANRHNTEIIPNANGIAGNTVTGQRSIYIVEGRRSDSKEIGSNLLVRHTLNTRVLLNGGLNYSWYEGQNFKVINDLLGGDFYLDINRFALINNPTNPSLAQSNALISNRLVKEGDRFGYDYNENIRKAGAWGQAQISLRRFQFFVGAEVGQNSFWRTGNIQVGLFPNNSLGDSEKFKYMTWGAKSGAVYKLNGRNYLYANGFYGTRAPQFRDVFLSPRTRNSTVDGVKNNTIQSVEGGYQLRAPYFKARFTGYLTNFLNETETYQLFSPTANTFGTKNVKGIDRRHVGIEAAAEAKVYDRSWVLSGAVSVGKFQYTNRPTMTVTADEINQPVADFTDVTVYQKNFYVPRVPQTVGAFSVKKEGKKFWFASLTFNYADNFWYDFAEERRTIRGVEGVDQGSAAWRTIIDQVKAPEAYTLDLFGGKSWRIKRKYFLALNVGVNNLLDKKDIIVSGRETFLNSVRDVTDARLYNSEIMYGLGINYFASVTFRM